MTKMIIEREPLRQLYRAMVNDAQGGPQLKELYVCHGLAQKTGNHKNDPIHAVQTALAKAAVKDECEGRAIAILIQCQDLVTDYLQVHDKGSDWLVNRLITVLDSKEAIAIRNNAKQSK